MDYQNEEIDTSQPAVPEQVSVALAELAGELREGLLALAVGTGLQVMAAIMEEDVTAVCGPRGRHDPERIAIRHSSGRGSVTLGGRPVPVERPRMRAVDGSGEVAVPAYELFSDTEVLGRMALERMLAGLSTRRYPLGLEPVGTRAPRRRRALRPSRRCHAGSSRPPRPRWPSCACGRLADAAGLPRRLRAESRRSQSDGPRPGARHRAGDRGARRVRHRQALPTDASKSTEVDDRGRPGTPRPDGGRSTPGGTLPACPELPRP